jgi:hypothetical protein
MTGPKPETEKEYIIEIYNRQSLQYAKIDALAEDVKRLGDCDKEHEKRIHDLEMAKDRQESYDKGRTSFWVNYKEFIQIFVSCTLSAGMTIMLFKMGLKP